MNFEQRAQALLAQRSTGANGVLAYAIVGNQNGPAHLVFAVMETNRVGVAVAGIPGGTQDVLAYRTGARPVRFELGKTKAAEAVLKSLKVKAPRGLSRAELDQYVVARLIESGFVVELETPIQAAIRETAEEHGLVINGHNHVGAPLEFRAPIVAKRSIEEAEMDLGKPMFSLDRVSTLAAVEGITSDLRSKVDLSEQVVFAIRFESFEGVSVERRERVESKIRGREGEDYYEEGTFKTAGEVREQLVRALHEEKREAKFDNRLARLDIVAAFGRLRVLEGIEAHLVSELRGEGRDVLTTGPADIALEPVRELLEYARRVTPDLRGNGLI